MDTTSFTTYEPSDLTQQELHKYLLTAVAPRPICFASTVDVSGNVNLSPFSFFNVFSSAPPIMIFSPARSGLDGTTKHTLDNVLEVKEVTINIVNYPLVEQMSLASTAYAKGVNEFTKAGLTAMPSDKVKPPRVKESPVAFECVVNDVVALGDGPGAGNLVICEVVKFHIDNRYLDESGFLDTVALDLVARMGGAHYSRCTPDSLFTIPKPIKTKGIGVDSLPAHAKVSKILTGNDLGRLGNVDRNPNAEELKNNQRRILDPINKELQEMDKESVLHRIHTIAQQQLTADDKLSPIATLINGTKYIDGKT